MGSPSHQPWCSAELQASTPCYLAPISPLANLEGAAMILGWQQDWLALEAQLQQGAPQKLHAELFSGTRSLKQKS